VSPEFAITWRQYDLDEATKSLLSYAEKLTKTPNLVEDQDIQELKNVDFDDDAIYEVTALISFYNFSGRMEAASGLPFDQIPENAQFAESQK
jgi:alkylhydroperoxidase family enzyme